MWFSYETLVLETPGGKSPTQMSDEGQTALVEFTASLSIPTALNLKDVLWPPIKDLIYSCSAFLKLSKSLLCSFILSPNKSLLHAYHVPEIVLDIGDIAMSKSDKNSLFYWSLPSRKGDKQ
jgi:hypothetical protein